MTEQLVEQLRESIKGKTWVRETRPYVIFVGEDKVAKGYKEEKEARHEFEIGVKLYEGGIQVPEMFSIISPDNLVYRLTRIFHRNGDSGIRGWFIIMQRIRGQTLNSLDTYLEATQTQLKEAQALRDRELEKVRRLGIKPDDVNPGNIIWNEEERKVYLIDFECYRFES